MTLSYDGSQFHGFQRQNDGTKTVANRLEEIFRSFGIESHFNASGRTDRGVHATGQVIDIVLPPFWQDLKRLKNYLNRMALPSIYIKRIERVGDDFHARYSAKKRLYRYLIKEGEPSVFAMPYLLYHDKLDIAKMQEAMKLFEGIHDFAYFSKSGSDPKSTIREIFKAGMYRRGDVYICYFEANGFLRSQIRMMVDFLLKISEGQCSYADLKMQLEKKVYKSRGLVAPNGLYLAKIWY